MHLSLAACHPGPARLIPSKDARLAITLSGVFVLSVADLFMTLTYVTSVGMLESNPIARWVMSLGCPDLLSVWKLCCVGLTIGLLIHCRKARITEPAAWLCLAVMIALTAHWARVNRDMAGNTAEIAEMAHAADDRWISIDAQ